MKHQAFFTLASASLFATALLGCAEPSTFEDDGLRGELLFDLSEDELEQIHDAYLAEEDLEMTRARLTAPFDCALYDDLCEQVGERAAYELTGDLVDFALEGAPLEDLEAHTDMHIAEAVALADAAEDLGEETFRASGSWYSQTSGSYRLMVRNGITTPVIGSRRAWTEAKTQRKSGLGIWSNKTATSICVDAGTNTQTFSVYTSSSGTSTSTIESVNPSNSCKSSEKTHTSSTYHARNNGIEGSGIQSWYTIRAAGRATAEINGNSFSRTAAAYTKIY